MKIIDVINSLEGLISTGAASEKDIIDAEKELGVTFAEEYKVLLAEFGFVLASEIEIVGIAKSQNRNVIAITKREHEYNTLVPTNFYVIENLGIDGIIIWQDENGVIYQSTPNKKPEKIYDCLVEYINAK